MSNRRITITLPDHLMDRVEYFYLLHGKTQNASDAEKIRFVLSYGLTDYIPSDAAKKYVEIRHGGQRKGAGRKKSE